MKTISVKKIIDDLKLDKSVVDSILDSMTLSGEIKGIKLNDYIYVMDSQDIEWIKSNLDQIFLEDFLNKFSIDRETGVKILDYLSKAGYTSGRVKDIISRTKSIKLVVPEKMCVDKAVRIKIEIDLKTEAFDPSIDIKADKDIKIQEKNIPYKELSVGTHVFSIVLIPQEIGDLSLDIYFKVKNKQSGNLITYRSFKKVFVYPKPPKLDIRTDISSRSVAYGDRIKLYLRIHNIGEGEAKDIKMLNLSDVEGIRWVTEAKKETSLVPTLPPGSTWENPFTGIAEKEGLISIKDLKITYNDALGNKIEEIPIETMEMMVKVEKPNIEVELDYPLESSYKEDIRLYISLFNKGKGLARNVNIEILEIGKKFDLIAGSLRRKIMELPPGKQKRFSVLLSPKKKGRIPLPIIKVTYRDVTGVDYEESIKDKFVNIVSEVRELKPNDVIDEKYEILDKIGEGTFAWVYKVRDTYTDKLYAIKILKPEYTASREFKESFLSEFKKIEDLSICEGIIKMQQFGYDASRGYYYILMDLMDGTLRGLIARRIKGEIDIWMVFPVIIDICAGIKCTHEKNIYHLDLKPENILYKKGKEGIKARISDFGLAKLFSEKITGMRGSYIYTAPELRHGGEVSDKADIYSLGLVIKELITGSIEGDIKKELMKEGVKPQIAEIISGYINRMLDEDPKNRPDASYIWSLLSVSLT